MDRFSFSQMVNYYSIQSGTNPTVQNYFRTRTFTNLQVLEEHNSTDYGWHKQGATKLLKLLNKYLLMVTFGYCRNYSV